MMNSKRNQTIAIARFLMYKHNLNQQLEGMTDEEYLADPIGLDVGSYVKDLMRYCRKMWWIRSWSIRTRF